MHADESHLNNLSQLVIGGAFTVLNALGAGFLEKVHENALAHERREAGLASEQALLVELKVVDTLNETRHARCIDYLKASGLRPGLLLNFDMKRLETERIPDTG
jgi:hypothetical protein